MASAESVQTIPGTACLSDPAKEMERRKVHHVAVQSSNHNSQDYHYSSLNLTWRHESHELVTTSEDTYNSGESLQVTTLLE